MKYEEKGRKQPFMRYYFQALVFYSGACNHVSNFQPSIFHMITILLGGTPFFSVNEG